MKQGDLFPSPLPTWARPATARELRDEAMERVEANAPATWKEQALAGIRKLCEARAEFICDDAWEYVDRPPEARALGPLMAQAARLGWCEKTERYEPSAQPQCHANPRRVWRSRIHEEKA